MNHPHIPRPWRLILLRSLGGLLYGASLAVGYTVVEAAIAAGTAYWQFGIKPWNKKSKESGKVQK